MGASELPFYATYGKGGVLRSYSVDHRVARPAEGCPVDLTLEMAVTAIAAHAPGLLFRSHFVVD
jgi:hypothetical protein